MTEEDDFSLSADLVSHIPQWRYRDTSSNSDCKFTHILLFFHYSSPQFAQKILDMYCKAFNKSSYHRQDGEST